METSAALGFGFRCGFLGLLHHEIIQERLTREYDLDLITTAPSVVYEVHLTRAKRDAATSSGQTSSTKSGRSDEGGSATEGGGRVIHLHNPADMPDPNRIEMIEEPWIEATLYVPDEYLGSVLKLCQDRRGIQKDLTYVGGRAQVKYELPLNEVVFDFYDRLKSISRGYASFDYHPIGTRPGDLVKMTILVNSEPVDALSMIVHRAAAEARGRHMCERLKDLIPRHLFKIPIQAAIGGKVIARETIAALRKDVTAKCYGGDASRKRKLLDKQKEGKKRMREYGSVSIPQEAFIAALRMGDES
jgi:GTP-binding protein LepA